jgi:hypothetical protein
MGAGIRNIESGVPFNVKAKELLYGYDGLHKITK